VKISFWKKTKLLSNIPKDSSFSLTTKISSWRGKKKKKNWGNFLAFVKFVY